MGSDVDLIAIVKTSKESFMRRAIDWDLTDLPVPAEILVYAIEEWESLTQQGRFKHELASEVLWIYDRSPRSGVGTSVA